MEYRDSNPLYFLTVAREHSITRAAEKLFISQPSLSQHINKVEKALGVRLFDRSRNPLQLTPEGKIYYRYLENSHYLYKKLRSELNEEHSQHVTMGVGTWRGAMLIPQVLSEFCKAYPQVRISLAEYPISELLTMLEYNKIDFAIMNGVLSEIPNGLVAETITTERIFLILSPENPLNRVFQDYTKAGQPLPMNLLDEECLITLDKSLTVGRIVSNFLQRHKLAFPRRIVTTNNATLIRLVSRNLGFGFMIEAGLRDDCCKNLSVFDLKAPELFAPLLLLTKENDILSPIAVKFIKAIKKYYQTKA